MPTWGIWGVDYGTCNSLNPVSHAGHRVSRCLLPSPIISARPSPKFRSMSIQLSALGVVSSLFAHPQTRTPRLASPRLAGHSTCIPSVRCTDNGAASRARRLLPHAHTHHLTRSTNFGLLDRLLAQYGLYYRPERLHYVRHHSPGNARSRRDVLSPKFDRINHGHCLGDTTRGFPLLPCAQDRQGRAIRRDASKSDLWIWMGTARGSSC